LDTVVIVGGGPGGAGASLGFSGRVDRIIVLEANSRLGLKPCGRGVPVVGDLGFNPPRDTIYHRIRRAIMYVDGRYLFELRDVFNGYILDKSRFLEAIFIESGAEVVYGVRFKPGMRGVRVNGSYVEWKKGVFSGGHPYYGGEKILAIQYNIASNQFDDADHLEIYFDTEVLGYYYIFPSSPGTVEIGVGGFMDFNRLKARLDKFIEGDERFRDKRRIKLEGARIAVGGVIHGFIDSLVKVGEAAGYVLPLTGEGIRPSMISGYEAALAIVEGRDPIEAMENHPITRGIRIQRRILDRVKSMDREDRRRLLTSLPPMVHAEVALGSFNKSRILRELVGKPRIALSVLKYIV